ncbi:MAG: DUF262 domain-containing protein [Thermoanaerobaculia bacterium]
MTDDTAAAGQVSASNPVFDEAESDAIVPHPRYDITSYGSDPDVEGLVRRIRRAEILVPSFQRDYVWRLPEASRFVESLLLGLPVPGVFFAIEPKTNKLLVIDGQQRLKTLQFFYDGVFNPRPGEGRQRVFILTDVDPRFAGKRYSTLEEPDRLRLDNSIIHATIIKQDSPPDEDTSVYHVFERLNSGGQKLAAQEIRVALYHGPLIDAIRELNNYGAWRELFGKVSAHLKDQELILRYLSLAYELHLYERPMSEFLSKFAGRHRHAEGRFLAEIQSKFTSAIDLVWSALGRRAFRPERAFNAAVFDSTMVGLTHLVAKNPTVDPGEVRRRYEMLLADTAYQEAVSRSTADETFVNLRISKAVEILGG